MDCWNSGIMGIKIGNNRFFVFLLTPSFQYSIIPIFQILPRALTPYGAGFQELPGLCRYREMTFQRGYTERKKGILPQRKQRTNGRGLSIPLGFCSNPRKVGGP